MRTAHWKAHLLPLLLLSLYSVSVCLAASCSFDDFVKHSGFPKAATAEAQQTGKDWEPLRIATSAKDLLVKSKYCRNKDGSFHERGAEGAKSDCEDVFDTLTAEKSKIVEGILEKAIALHMDRLLVQRVVGPLKIPDLSEHPYCKFFNIPADHYTTGVANADMVLYAAYIRDAGDDAASLGLTCAKSAGGRPIAGALMFAKENTEISRFTVRFAAHQIAHALGFSYSEMNSLKMSVDKTVRGKPNSVAVVKSDKTKQMAQAHYGCPTAEGMELEDGEKNDKKTLSHWERRNAKDELMATPLGGPGTLFMGFYTSLTLAAFEDMGFYKANFKMAEDMLYGYKAGCDFLTGKCMDKGATKWPNMFCDEPESKGNADFCTTDRLGLGGCILRDDDSPSLPDYFQYFTSDKKGGDAAGLTDHCPVVEQDSPFGCQKTEQAWSAPGSLFGTNSMCLDGSELKAKLSGAAVTVGAVCAAISCEGGSVRVKYDGDKTDKWYDCPEGKTLTPSTTSDSFVSGTIKCPKYKEVCTVALDGSSLVPKKVVPEPTTPPSPSASPSAPDKPTGKPDGSNSGGKSKDGSSVPFGLIPSVAFLVLSFAGYLIA